MINSIDIIRAVASRAAEDPVPPADRAKNGAQASLPGALPRILALMARLMGAGTPSSHVLQVIAQALATFLPLVDTGATPAEPARTPATDTKTDARIGILRQERDARARARGEAKADAATGRARPDIPPSERLLPDFRALAGPSDEAWNDLLDLTSEALETVIAFGDTAGIGRCVELLDVLAEAFGIDFPEAA